MRRLTLMAISKEMATKDDLERLREATKDGIEELREAVKGDVERLREELKSYVDARMSGLNLSLSARINDLYGVVRAPLVAIVVTLASTILVPLALRLLLP
jgi:flagellar biosynthesis/type III secretory pathway protein FliH